VPSSRPYSLANMLPQTAALNRGVWEGIESAVCDLSMQQGELYVVTGPVFESQELKSVRPNSVLVPSLTWKAVYDPRAGGAGAYVCTNAAAPRCDVISVAALIRMTDVDLFPPLPACVKEVATALTAPEDSSYAPGRCQSHRQKRGVFN